MATYHTLVFDVENVVGQPLPANNGSPATASIWYDRDIILTSGALIPANTVVVTDIPSTGTASAQVIPADDPDVASGSQGFGIIVLIQWESGSGAQYQRYSRQYTAQVLSADAATVNLSAKIGAEPMQQSMETVQEVFNQAAAAGIQGPAGPAGPAGPPPTDANVSPILKDSTSQSYAAVQAAVQPALDGKISKGTLVINVRDYGAKGDGSTDDTAAVQAAINAAGVGGRVTFPLGTFGMARFKCGPLTMLDYQTLDGTSGSVTKTAVPTVELYFPGLPSGQVAITGANENTYRAIEIRGPGSSTSTTGISTPTTAATYDYCYVMSFGTGIAQSGTYYSVFNRCGWLSNGVGLALTGCYNVNLNNPRFACQNETGTAWGTAIQADTVRPLTINGGSIEEFGAGGGINITAAQSIVTMTGTYWESSTATTSPIGIKAASLGSLTLNLLGHMVYMTNLASWVNVSSSSCKINSSGHRFSCAAGSPTTPQAYAYSAGYMVGQIGPDDWTDVAKACSYHGQAVPTAGLRAVVPAGVSTSLDTVVLQGRAPVQAQTTVTANYTVTANDSTIVCNSASALTVSLPDPLSGTTARGRRFTIKNRGGGVVTVNCANAARTIDGSTSQTLNQWGCIVIENDLASGWLIVSRV